jgi:hypothetical protein
LHSIADAVLITSLAGDQVREKEILISTNLQLTAKNLLKTKFVEFQKKITSELLLKPSTQQMRQVSKFLS